jgi:outer membrane protein
MLIATGVFVFALPVSDLMAQSERIVYYNSQRVFQEYKDFRDAQDLFDKEVDEWTQEGYDMQKELDSLKTEFDKQRLILSPAKVKEKQDEIETKTAALQKFTADIFGPNGKAEQRNQQLTKGVLDKVTAVLEKIGVESNYLMILDAAAIGYAKKSLDITDKVLEELAELH